MLAAEDNPTNQKLVVLLLEQHGHRVTTVGSGREAVAKAAEGPFEVILMDVQMPDMDGFEATAAIRRREIATGVHTPIIAMTAHAMPGDRERCLAGGMDAYVPKPLRLDELLSTIDGFFSAKPGDAAAPAASSHAGQTRASTVDGEALLENLAQNKKLLSEVITVFLSEAPKQLATLRAATDAPALAAAAHAIKGAVGLFAKGEAFDAARRLELAARSGDLTDLDERRGDIERELGRVCADLETLLRASSR